MEYKTKDIYEASALLAKGIKLLKLQPENNFYWFVFENIRLSTNTSESYWRNELQIPAKTYADAIKTLKDRLFART